MTDEKRAPGRDEEEAGEGEARHGEAARSEDRLKDLDVTDPHGDAIKGGVPTVVDGSPRR